MPFAQKYFGYAANSVLYPPLDARHPPKGLYAMILLAVCLFSFCFYFLQVDKCYFKVERAFVAHLSGMYIAPPAFAHQHYWQPLATFLSKIDRVSERCWKELLMFRSATEASGDDTDSELWADQSMILAYRADLYIPSSPFKA